MWLALTHGMGKLQVQAGRVNSLLPGAGAFGHQLRETGILYVAVWERVFPTQGESPAKPVKLK